MSQQPDQQPAPTPSIPLPPIGGDWKKWAQWALIAALALSQLFVGASAIKVVFKADQTADEVKKVKDELSEVKTDVKAMLHGPAAVAR